MVDLNLENTNWYYCPGSIDKEKAYEPKEYNLENLKNIQNFVSSGLIPPIPNKNDFKRFKIACGYISNRSKELTKLFKDSNVELKTDVSIDLSEYIPNPNVNLFAKIHMAIVVRNKQDKVLHIEVIQYSDRNLYINVNNNPMLIGCLKSLIMDNGANDITSLRATIIQPGIDSDPIRHQNYTTWSFELLSKKLFDVANVVDDENAKLISGKHCHWCLHKANCEEIIETKKQEINKMDGGELSIIQSVHTDLKTMDASELADILDAEASFKDAFERARAEAKLRAEKGEIVANDEHQYMIGHGRKVKAWNESEEVIVKKLKGMKVIKDEIFPSKLITPAASLKLELTEKQLTNLRKLISEIDGKPTLIKTDRVVMSSEQAFADVVEKPVEQNQTMSFL